MKRGSPRPPPHPDTSHPEWPPNLDDHRSHSYTPGVVAPEHPPRSKKNWNQNSSSLHYIHTIMTTKLMKMSVCEGCETEHEKKYIYVKCKTCGEKVCGWCSYDTTTGTVCIKCGFSCARADDHFIYCEKRKRFIPTKDECERLATRMKNCPYSHIFTPDTTPVAPAPKNKVKLVILKKSGEPKKAWLISSYQKETNLLWTMSLLLNRTLHRRHPRKYTPQLCLCLLGLLRREPCPILAE